MAAPSCASHLLSCQIFTAVIRIVRIWPIRAAYPFPAIAGHVEYTIGAGSLGKAADSAKVVPSGVEMSAGSIGALMTPRIFPAIRSSCRLLPLCFRGQALAEPSAVGRRSEPRGFDNRTICVAVVGYPVTIAPVNARIVVVDIVIFFSTCSCRTDRV